MATTCIGILKLLHVHGPSGRPNTLSFQLGSCRYTRQGIICGQVLELDFIWTTSPRLNTCMRWTVSWPLMPCVLWDWIGYPLVSVVRALTLHRWWSSTICYHTYPGAQGARLMIAGKGHPSRVIHKSRQGSYIRWPTKSCGGTANCLVCHQSRAWAMYQSNVDNHMHRLDQ